LGQRAALYCRVSTADQSCARQERDLTAFADRAGYEVVGVFKRNRVRRSARPSRTTQGHGTRTGPSWAEGRGFFNIAAALERALSSTLTVAEFVRRGQAAQKAVDAILSAERSKRKN
jgi:hypothetical protein